MPKNCTLIIRDKETQDAGIKAKLDINYFLRTISFDNIDLKLNINSKIEKFLFLKFKMGNILKKTNYDNYFFQYPAYSAYLEKQVVKISRKKNAHIYLIIHDVESLRKFKNDSRYVSNEMELFNQVDGLIVHNKKMRDWLLNQGIKSTMVELEVFDYNNPQPINSGVKYEGSICFAGNLKKSEFIEELNIKHKLSVFGPEAREMKFPKNINYCGQYTPEDLPKYLRQNFGLVWDGNSIESCNGVFGEYMRYNNPHKISLYISSGLPVIVWSESAMAGFIKKNNLGLVVSSLANIDDELDRISESDYQIMKKNVERVGKKMRNGFFIKKAVNKILKIIDQSDDFLIL